MSINYFLLVSPSGVIIGPGSQAATQKVTTFSGNPPVQTTTTQPLPLPANCIPCTQTQAETWQTLEYVGGALQTIPAAAQLQAAQTAQRTLITASAVAAMTGGFQSSALGAAYTYPSTLTDQHNLSGSVVASLLPNLPSTWTTPFWCQDSAGTWAMVQHTAAQIQQVGLDEKAWIVSCQEKLAGLNAQIAAAQTVSGVQAITFS